MILIGSEVPGADNPDRKRLSTRQPFPSWLDPPLRYLISTTSASLHTSLSSPSLDSLELGCTSIRFLLLAPQADPRYRPTAIRKP